MQRIVLHIPPRGHYPPEYNMCACVHRPGAGAGAGAGAGPTSEVLEFRIKQKTKIKNVNYPLIKAK